jgi:hypothetical protein
MAFLVLKSQSDFSHTYGKERLPLAHIHILDTINVLMKIINNMISCYMMGMYVFFSN